MGTGEYKGGEKMMAGTEPGNAVSEGVTEQVAEGLTKSLYF